jgi:hypothetical protein
MPQPLDKEQVESQKRIDPDYALRGKTLAVYLYFLRYKHARGISEVQHAFGFSSPSIAAHHLEKLLRLGVVTKDEFGSYNLEKKVDVGILQGFVNIGSLILPRFAFYAGFFLVISVSYILLNLHYLDFFALVGTIGAVAVFLYESWRSWRGKPFQ